jgi:hypothetical protein
MDELTLMREFRAERVTKEPEARAAIWRALEARIEAAAEAGAGGKAPAAHRGFLARRRRILAFGGAMALAAITAGALVLGSGPTAQPAAAEVLHRTAAVAAEGEAPAPIPGPGQYLHRSFESLELEGWLAFGTAGPDEPTGFQGGLMDNPGAFNALMPTSHKYWVAPDGSGRVREVAGTPRFIDEGEQARWEAAGSPLPPPFDPAYQRRYASQYRDALEVGRGVVDREGPKLLGFRFPDTSQLPTEPEALRQAVEANDVTVSGFNLMYRSAERLGEDQTIAELFNILSEGSPMSPQLRAAIFDALGELPGIEIDSEAQDFLGRQGDAVRSLDPKTGTGVEFVFDPATAEILSHREFISDATRAAKENPALKGLPAGQTIRETAYEETAVVDSTHMTGGAGAEGPAAGTDPDYRR